jgi:hypothetical protein
MNKLAVSLVAVTFVTISSVSQATNNTSQTKCTLTESSAPTVRGLRLGMSAQELLALFPNITRKKEMKDAIEQAKSATGSEAVYLGFDPATDGDARQFAGVDSVSAGFYKARVVDLNLQYAGATWKNIDEWIARVSETFKLPGAQDWVVGPNEAPNKVLTCEGVMIEAAIQGGSSSFRIRNSAYQRELDERAKAAEERKRTEIKP